ncbi:hypothetical protein [Haliovirga abyssi]|uniref:GH18 domain-containing protein n=1 Tax=Haliovirga abyssi TaxID=2996794 RepID=A0AAU9DMK3_9FUSO|nr:hypothetical protein [Haliovirga abyssi]BDU51252.1 hypothetical protein HLVA_18210 [Haliovirga abyssi]
MNIKKIKIVFILFMLITPYIFSKEGIIVGNDDKILKTFRDGKKEDIIKLADDMSRKYSSVILHLGSRYVFKKGSFFYYKTSRENLQIFSNHLKKNNIKLYLWFFDSYGEEKFNEIYEKYKSIFNENIDALKKLDIEYSGLVVDFERINGASNKFKKRNNEKLIEILKYVRGNLKNKKLYIFASIVDSKIENKNRGYSEDEILKYVDNIIPMLYIKDEGFVIKKGLVYPVMRDERVNQLIKYYKSKKYKIAVSWENGIIIKKGDNLYFIKTAYRDNIIFKNLKEIMKVDFEKYRIYYYQAKNNFDIKRNDLVVEKISKGNVLYFIELKENIKQDTDFIWEYFLVNRKI